MARQSVGPFDFGSPMGLYDPFLAMQREMGRLLEIVRRGNVLPSGDGQGADVVLMPQMDVTETDDEIRVTAELPGVSERDVEVMLNDDLLTIRAEKKVERKEERQAVHFTERAFGVFQRSIRLPFVARLDQVKANYENGVLTVTVPKEQGQDRNRRVQVQGAASAGQPSNQDTTSGAQVSPSEDSGARGAGGATSH